MSGSQGSPDILHSSAARLRASYLSPWVLMVPDDSGNISVKKLWANIRIREDDRLVLLGRLPLDWE